MVHTELSAGLFAVSKSMQKTTIDDLDAQSGRKIISEKHSGKIEQSRTERRMFCENHRMV